MKHIITIIILAFPLFASAQTQFRDMTNIPVRMETLATSNFTSVGTFKADSETGIWLRCWGTNANATGNLSTVWYVSRDGTNYGTEPITFNFTPGGTATNIIRTNLSLELSRFCRTFRLSQITNASASTVWVELDYSRKY